MKKPLHPEVGIATRKLRADARIDRWPLEQRKLILQWLADGDGLRDVAAKIDFHFKKQVHYTTVGKFYARERRRDLAMDFTEVSDLYQTMTNHAARNPVNFTEALQLALGMEFMRAYSTNRLSPNDLLRYCQTILRQRQTELRAERFDLEKKRFEKFQFSPNLIFDPPILPPEPAPEVNSNSGV